MTQTLRRELRIKFEEILERFSDKMSLPEREPLAESLADAALEVAGIAKKFRDPTWDLLHGLPLDEEGIRLARVAEINTDIANRLSAGLRRGEFPQTIEAQKVYRWIAEREAEGQSLDRWIQWAMDSKRAEYSFIYHKDVILIKRDWPQVAWPTITTQPAKEGAGFYG